MRHQMLSASHGLQHMGEFPLCGVKKRKVGSGERWATQAARRTRADHGKRERWGDGVAHAISEVGLEVARVNRLNAAGLEPLVAPPAECLPIVRTRSHPRGHHTIALGHGPSYCFI
jgi:hypothetical protein